MLVSDVCAVPLFVQTTPLSLVVRPTVRFQVGWLLPDVPPVVHCSTLPLESVTRSPTPYALLACHNGALDSLSTMIPLRNPLCVDAFHVVGPEAVPFPLRAGGPWSVHAN